MEVGTVITMYGILALVGILSLVYFGLMWVASRPFQEGRTSEQ